MFKQVTLFASVALLAACQTAPDVQQLMDQNKEIQNQLASANQRIVQLETDNRLKQQDIAELNRVLSVLDTEKTSRVSESSQLRGQVRKFVQDQIDALKRFLVEGNLLDYIGGELVERTHTEDKSIFIVDLDHPVPRNGTLTGVGAFFANPVPFQVKILRPVENDLVVIWESQTIVVREPGNMRFEFPVTVGLEKGDYLGYYFPQAAGVTFDEGTGDTRYLNKNVSLGGKVGRSSLMGESKRRAYSVGVYGLLN